jgi:hypothetical protein
MVTTTATYMGPVEAATTAVANRITAGSMSPVDFIDSHKKMWARQNGRELVFRGMVEVEQVANGYLINISYDPQKPSMSYIANSLQEVNDIITAQIVCFKLEGKEE